MLLLLLSSPLDVGTAMSVDTFTTAGNHIWECPENVYSISLLELWGSGGEGSSVNGAGGGAYAKSVEIDVVPGLNYLISIGLGAETIFTDDAGNVIASARYGEDATEDAAGSGGSAALSVGDVTYDGGAGSTLGGGGSSAGNGSRGNDAFSDVGAEAVGGGGPGGDTGASPVTGPGGGGGSGFEGYVGKVSITYSEIDSIEVGTRVTVTSTFKIITSSGVLTIAGYCNGKNGTVKEDRGNIIIVTLDDFTEPILRFKRNQVTAID